MTGYSRRAAKGARPARNVCGQPEDHSMTDKKKRSKFIEYPLFVLRTAAAGAVIVHLFLGLFVGVLNPWIFFSTAIVIALLLSREMYEDMARRFFQLKSDQLEERLPEAPLEEATVIDSKRAIRSPEDGIIEDAVEIDGHKA
ncbi:hypothetical protein [Phaeovulum veldkampii]|nr:hypothetical protein [Phaeovulum veldkampii]